MTKERVIEELKDKMTLLPEFGSKDDGTTFTWQSAFETLRVDVFLDDVVLSNGDGARSIAFGDISAINITDGMLQIISISTLE